MVDELMSAYGDNFLVAVLGVVLGLLFLFIVLWLLRSRGPSPFVRGGRNRQPRLQVLDAAAVDTRRRIVLIRRDNVEHLVMIGGPTDIVIETGIGEIRETVLAAPAARPNETTPPNVAAEMQDIPLAAPIAMPAAPAAARPPYESDGAVSAAQSVRAPSPTPARNHAAAPAPAPTLSSALEISADGRPQGSSAGTQTRPANAAMENLGAPHLRDRGAVNMSEPQAQRTKSEFAAPGARTPSPMTTSRAAPPASEPLPQAPVSAPIITAERRNDSTTQTVDPIAAPTARSEPALFAAAALMPTVSSAATITRAPDERSPDIGAERIRQETKGPSADSLAASFVAPDVRFDGADRPDTASAAARPAPSISASPGIPSPADDKIEEFSAIESDSAPSFSIEVPQETVTAAPFSAPPLSEPVDLESRRADAISEPSKPGLTPLFDLEPQQQAESPMPKVKDFDEEMALAHPSIVGSVTELPHELTEIDDIYVPEEEATIEPVNTSASDDGPGKHVAQDTREEEPLDLPKIEEVLEAARQRILPEEGRPEPRPFPQERFDRMPEPVQTEQSSAPKREMSDFERVLEQEMAIHLASSPTPPHLNAAEKTQRSMTPDALTEGPRLPADLLLGEGLVGRRSGNNLTENAKADDDPNLQNEIARIFGEMSASRNS